MLSPVDYVCTYNDVECGITDLTSHCALFSHQVDRLVLAFLAHIVPVNFGSEHLACGRVMIVLFYIRLHEIKYDVLVVRQNDLTSPFGSNEAAQAGTRANFEHFFTAE